MPYQVQWEHDIFIIRVSTLVDSFAQFVSSYVDTGNITFGTFSSGILGDFFYMALLSCFNFFISN